MPVRAENDPKFSRRFLYMGIAAIGFALWSLYDGAIGYPHKQERAKAFDELLTEKKTDQWEAYATERGWSTAIPDQPKTEDDYKGSIWMQYAQFVVAGLLGLWLISIPLRARGRWIESTETGINSSWGQTLNFSDVTEVNKRQWRSKGIARISYLDGGRRKKFVIDDYKFDRYKTDEILYELEQNIDPSLITNGPPEPPPGENPENEPVEADSYSSSGEPS